MVETSLVFNFAVSVGFPYENLARFLQYTATASGLDEEFSKRVTYRPEDPFRITFVGPLALPIIPVMGIHKKQALDPSTAFPIAYSLSKGGTDFGYLPPLDQDTLAENFYMAQGEYAVWLTKQDDYGRYR